MNVFVIIFMVIASIFAIGTLGYVTVDIVLEIRNKDKPEEEKKEEPVVVAAPIVDAAHEVMPEFVEHIDAEEADAMISDSLAMKTANYESGAGHGQQGIINIGVLDDNFNAHDVITLAVLKEKGLISSKVGRMKVLADGMLNKPLTIKSESYSIQAIKMIELTGGTVIILKD
jgi:hypothetical protein